MIEQSGKSSLMKSHGSGMIRLVWVSSSAAGGVTALRSGNVNPLSVNGAKGLDTAPPALSCQMAK